MMNCSKREERSRSGGFELSTLKVVDFDHFSFLSAQSRRATFVILYQIGNQVNNIFEMSALNLKTQFSLR